ncbi:unnamed protein product [Closterium sp. NIES-65]|nr:unnamed protein product [Closterium sp. NIES-65]
MATATARSLVCAHFTAAQLSPAEGESSSLKAFAKSVKPNGLSAFPLSRKSVSNRRRTCANGSSSRRRQPVMAAAGDGATKKCRITLLPGDGIGPEIMAVAVKLLKALGELEGITFEFQEALVGGAAIDEFGVPLPESTLATCRDSDAVLLAAIGGYKWDTLPADLRPERGLLGLRAGLGAFANLRPATVFPQLIEASSLKREVVEGVDIMVVRELTGGIYFGEPKGFGLDAEGNRTGFNTMIYSAPEIDRIARVGFEAARKRSGRLCSVEKSNVLEVSQLWRERVTAIGAEEYPDVELSHMYVDNAAMQLIRNPRQFDTIVTGNIFGDILSDEASMLTGSIGMLPSASIGSDGPGIYEPVHGSAPDIAGQDKANPMAQVLSAAMMLRYGLNLPRGADLLEAAVMSTLEAGYRTGDIASPGMEVVGCTSAIPLGTVSSIPFTTVTQAPPLATASAMSGSGVEWEVLVPSLVGVTPASALIAATAAAGALGLGFALFIAGHCTCVVTLLVEWEVLVPSLVGVTPASALLAATAAAGALGLGFVLFLAVGVLFQPRWIITWVRQNQPHILFEHVTKDRLVALTIDDGPNGDTTHELLDILKEHGCTATFFVIGSNIDRYPSIVDRMHAEGHEVGNHMTADEPSWRLSAGEFESSLLEVDAKLLHYFRRDAGGNPVKWFRPGHGWYTKRMRQQAQRHGYNVALGSVFPVDPLFKDSSRPLAAYCLWKVYPGAIIILHDRPQQGTQTVEILRMMLPELRRQGYQVVSLSHLHHPLLLPIPHLPTMHLSRLPALALRLDGAARVLWTKRVLASAQRKTSSPFTYKQPELKIDTMDWTVKHARLGGDPLNGFDVFLTGVLTFNALIYNPNAYGLKINAIYVHAEYNNTFLGNSKLPPMNVYPLKSSPVKAPFNLVNIPMKKGWRIYQKGDVLATKIDIQGFGRFTGFGIKSPVMQVRTTCYVKYVLKAALLSCVLLAAAASCAFAAPPKSKPPSLPPMPKITGIPFPGIRRCLLTSSLSSKKVLSASLGGDSLATGSFRSTIYQQGNRTMNIKIHFDVEGLTLPLPPTNQTLYDGRRGSNGTPIWELPNAWTVGGAPDELKMDTWITDATRKLVPGTTMTFYSMFQKIDATPRNFYIVIRTEAFPDGAIRGQMGRPSLVRWASKPVC